MATRKPKHFEPPPKAQNKFTVEVMEALVDDLKSKRIPLDRLTITDDMVPSLRAVIRNSGAISFHVHYDIAGSRPFLKLGSHPEMSIKEARELARTVIALAERGIDPAEGLHERLIRELKEKGTKWRP